MTSRELYNRIHPLKTKTYSAQLLSDGLSVNVSDIYSRLITDAARCNGYRSDVFYDLKTIENALKEYNPDNEFEPIWIGFRKLGVDGTDFVLCRISKDNVFLDLDRNYFALYSLTIEPDEYNYYNVIFNEYGV